jgi:N-acetyl-anhydromuramyl-L-alanine amidase AmpD
MQANGRRPNGAHFMIEKDGTVYQTASLNKTTNHVGDLQSRCLLKKACSGVDLQAARKLDQTTGNRRRADLTNKAEFAKSFPDRFPYNDDSIGIEIVGMAPQDGPNKNIYEPVNDTQNASLKWLIKELADNLKVSMQEIYRHSEIGRKMPTEASTAKW